MPNPIPAIPLPSVIVVNRLRGVFARPPGTTFDCVHPHHVIAIHTIGRGRYVSGNEEIAELRAPYMGVLPAGEADRNGMVGAYDIRYCLFDGGGLESTPDQREAALRIGHRVVRGSHTRFLDADDARVVRASFDELARLRRDTPAAELRASALVVQLLAMWAAGVAPDDAIERYRAAIAAHAADARVGLGRLARDLGHDPDALGARFARRHGATPVAYRLRLRLERARERLAAGATVADAARDAGFADPAYFARRFRRAFALTPSAFARTARMAWADR